MFKFLFILTFITTIIIISDLCIKNKKIFAHEHTLYTYSQLHKHMKYGDKALNKEDSGFDGHPECQFCRKRFYGNDELFLHCREKHEQCHICVRNGVRHEYYPDYNGLVNIQYINICIIRKYKLNDKLKKKNSLYININRKNILEMIIIFVCIVNVWIKNSLYLNLN